MNYTASSFKCTVALDETYSSMMMYLEAVKVQCTGTEAGQMEVSLSYIR